MVLMLIPVLVLAVFYLLYASEQDLCSKRSMDISDAELIRTVNLAIKKELDSEMTTVDEDGNRVVISTKERLYPNWAFSPDNPSCCHVIREEKSFWKALFEGRNITVEVSPKIEPVFPVGSDSNYRFIFDACGVLKWSDIGLPNTHQSKIEVNRLE